MEETMAMSKVARTLIGTATALWFTAPLAFGAENAKLTGLWKLVTFQTVDVQTGKASHPYGERPWGYISIGNGRFDAWASSDSPERQSRRWEAAIFYSGTIRLDGKVLLTKLEAIRHEGWTNTFPFDLAAAEGLTQNEEPRAF